MHMHYAVCNYYNYCETIYNVRDVLVVCMSLEFVFNLKVNIRVTIAVQLTRALLLLDRLAYCAIKYRTPLCDSSLSCLKLKAPDIMLWGHQ